MIGWMRFVLPFCLMRAGAAAGESLTLVTEDLPPYSMAAADGTGVTGMSTEIVRAVFDEAGIGYSITILPWPRAYRRALETIDTCVYSAARTPAREASFRWAGPLIRTEAILFGRSDSPKVSSLRELDGHRIGGYYFDATTAYLKEKGLRVDESADNELNLRKLLAGRIDYWAADRAVVRYYEKAMGAGALVPILKLREVFNYLACNRAVSEETMGRIDAALGKMRADGRIDAILAKYR